MNYLGSPLLELTLNEVKRGGVVVRNIPPCVVHREPYAFKAPVAVRIHLPCNCSGALSGESLFFYQHFAPPGLEIKNTTPYLVPDFATRQKIDKECFGWLCQPRNDTE